MFVNIIAKSQKECKCYVCGSTIEVGSKYYCAGGTAGSVSGQHVWISGRRFCVECTQVSELVCGYESTKQYLHEHTEPCDGLPVTFRRTTSDLPAFKKLVYRSPIRINTDQMYFNTEVIANLILPKGTTLFADVRYKDKYLRKIRADQALVHSMFAIQRAGELARPRTEGKMGFVPLGTKEVQEAYSPNSNQVLKYKPGHLMVPTRSYSFAALSCASGIHLYLSLRDACEHRIR